MPVTPGIGAGRAEGPEPDTLRKVREREEVYIADRGG
jgi:hypothetical protein